jgi:hypothetical protein
MEIKLDVYRAVGKKLPKELFDMVLRFTLLAEEVPLKPGVFDQFGKAVIKCYLDTFEVSRSELI